ncbi:hypothetical protein B0H12DRAFT_823917 [Mycena haematopus]|nr:hypothetical protein B0H12DRAFT_823917 [Mycena haematopus]
MFALRRRACHYPYVNPPFQLIHVAWILHASPVFSGHWCRCVRRLRTDSAARSVAAALRVDSVLQQSPAYPINSMLVLASFIQAPVLPGAALQYHTASTRRARGAATAVKAIFVEVVRRFA